MEYSGSVMRGDLRTALYTIRPFTIVLLTAAAALAQSTTVNVRVGNQTDTSAGINGRLQLAMSTSFQLAGWNYQFFGGAPKATTELTSLYPWRTRVQVVSDGIPLTALAPGTSRNSIPCSRQSRGAATIAPSSRSARRRRT